MGVLLSYVLAEPKTALYSSYSLCLWSRKVWGFPFLEDGKGEEERLFKVYPFVSFPSLPKIPILTTTPCSTRCFGLQSPKDQHLLQLRSDTSPCMPHLPAHMWVYATHTPHYTSKLQRSYVHLTQTDFLESKHCQKLMKRSILLICLWQDQLNLIIRRISATSP